MNVYWEIVIVLLVVVVCMMAIKLWRVNNHLYSRDENTVCVLNKYDSRLNNLENELGKYRVWKEWQSESINSFSSKAENLENEMIDLTTRHNSFKRVIMDAICGVIRDVHDLKKMAYTTIMTVDSGKLKENPKAPVKYTFYPCFVYHTDNEFHWSYTKPWCFIGGNNYPKDEGNVKIEVNCTVEVLEYPDGRYSAAWFPGEFREEEA